MKTRRITITRGFDSNELPIGYIELMADDALAKVLFSDAVLVQSVFAPAYYKKDDGTIKLSEFSLIPAANAAGLINRGIEKAEAGDE